MQVAEKRRAEAEEKCVKLVSMMDQDSERLAAELHARREGEEQVSCIS